MARRREWRRERLRVGVRNESTKLVLRERETISEGRVRRKTHVQDEFNDSGKMRKFAPIAMPTKQAVGRRKLVWHIEGLARTREQKQAQLTARVY